MKILFCGGGTAGHVTPSIAIAERLLERIPDSDIAFIGRVGGKENAQITKRGYTLYTLDVEGLSRSHIFDNLRRLRKMRKAETHVRKIISEFRPDAIFATGGYVSFPGLYCGIKRNIPTFLHESNAASGAVTRLLSKKCTAVFVGSRGNHELAALKNAVYTGNPTLKAFTRTDRRRSREKLGIRDTEILIVSVGGSLGAEALNEAAIAVMKSYSIRSDLIKHIHATGQRYYDEIAKSEPSLVKGSSGCKIIPYIDDMAGYLSAADVAICRGGAMTLAELSACRATAIVIPSPNVSADHQTKNAQEYEKHGAIKLLCETEQINEDLNFAVRELCEDNALREKMRSAYEKVGNIGAADKIIDIMLKAMNI